MLEYWRNMNTEMNQANEAKEIAIEMSQETLQTLQSANNNLHVSGVRAHFQAHYTDAKIDLHGIASMVKDILRQAQAEFPRNAHHTEIRNIVIAHSLFTEEIYAKAQERFFAGSDRGKHQAIRNVLSTYCKNEIAKIKGTNNPHATGDYFYDSDRPCAKPRCKWYLIASK